MSSHTSDLGELLNENMLSDLLALLVRALIHIVGALKPCTLLKASPPSFGAELESGSEGRVLLLGIAAAASGLMMTSLG